MIDYPYHVEFFAEGITIDASFRNREDGTTFMKVLEQTFPNGSNNDKEMNDGRQSRPDE